MIRNKASGTVLHLLSPSEYEIGEHCDIVGWQQETTDLETLGRQVWWVEWDEHHQGYIISSTNNRGVVLDVVGSRSGMVYLGSKALSTTEEKLVCARARVRGGSSAKSSRRSSVRSSLEVVRRDMDLVECANGGDGYGMALTENSINDRIRSQRWVLRRTQPSSECFSIHNLLYPNIALDLDWGKPDNGTKVQLCTRTGVNHQQWNFIIPPIPSMNPPIGSWVCLINHKSGGFLHHTDINYPPACIKVPKWDGIGEKREFHGLHWCFVLADDRSGRPKWYIKNRLTGTMLEHWSGRRKGDSVKADSYLYTESKEWKMELLPAGSPAEGKFKTGLWGIINSESECALDHYGMKSVQAYSPGPMKDESRQWRIMEVSGPYVDFGAATLLSPPSHATPPLPTLSASCTALPLASTYPASSSLQPLVMPSVSSFHYLEHSIWPFPAAAPSSRDKLGHEERCFFELLSRIETQLIVPGPYTTHRRRTSTASAPTTPGSINGSITPPTLLPPSRPRSAVLTLPMGFFDLVNQAKNYGTPPSSSAGLGDKKDPFLMLDAASKTTLTLLHPTGTTFLSLPPPPVPFTKKRILPEAEGWTTWALGYSVSAGAMTNWNSLVESHIVRHSDRRDRYIVCFYEAVTIIRDLINRYYDSQNAILPDGGVVVLPSRLTWMVMLASASLDKILRLRKAALEEDTVVYGRMGIVSTRTEGEKAAREVDEWVVKELERVKFGWGLVEGVCRAGVARKNFVY